MGMARRVDQQKTEQYLRQLTTDMLAKPGAVQPINTETGEAYANVNAVPKDTLIECLNTFYHNQQEASYPIPEIMQVSQQSSARA